MLEIIKNNPTVLFLIRWATIIIWCSYILSITTLIIYVGYAKNLDKCDVNFDSWMFSSIVMGFTFITLTLEDRRIGNDRFSAKCATIYFLVLWIIACVYFTNSNKTGIYFLFLRRLHSNRSIYFIHNNGYCNIFLKMILVHR